MGRISVIIPTYNRADFLIEAIKAILEQSYAVHQIIVVDDGSTDRTRAAVSTLIGRIQYVYQPNAGKSAALNEGLVHCSGDYVWICDDDDLALPNAAELLVNALENNQAAGFAFGRYRQFYTEAETGAQKVCEPLDWPKLDSESLLVSLLEDCFIFQGACLVRKEAFDAVGPFRTDLIRSQDYEMTIRLVRRFEAVYVPEVVFMQRVHARPRGSAQDRFDPSRQLEKWLHYCGIIFRELYSTMSLSEFTPKCLCGSDVAPRAALLERARVVFRWKLFDYSLRDISSAIQMGYLGRLTQAEVLVCGRLLHALVCEELIEKPKIADELHSLAAVSQFGTSVVKAVTAPLLWHARQSLMHGRWREGYSFAKLLLRFHGVLGSLTLVERGLARRLKF